MTIELIEKLQPNPGTTSTSDYSGLLTLDTDVSYVTPDLIVQKAGEDWIVSLTDGTSAFGAGEQCLRQAAARPGSP